MVCGPTAYHRVTNLIIFHVLHNYTLQCACKCSMSCLCTRSGSPYDAMHSTIVKCCTQGNIPPIIKACIVPFACGTHAMQASMTCNDRECHAIIIIIWYKQFRDHLKIGLENVSLKASKHVHVQYFLPDTLYKSKQ